MDAPRGRPPADRIELPPRTNRHAARTGKESLSELVSPSASRTIRFTYLVSAYLNVLTNLHPVNVSQMIDPLLFSKLQVQVSGPLPVDRLP